MLKRCLATFFLFAIFGGVALAQSYPSLPDQGPLQDKLCPGHLDLKPGDSLYKHHPGDRQNMLDGGRDAIYGNDCKVRFYHVDENGKIIKQSDDVNMAAIRRNQGKPHVSGNAEAVKRVLTPGKPLPDLWWNDPNLLPARLAEPLVVHRWNLDSSCGLSNGVSVKLRSIVIPDQLHAYYVDGVCRLHLLVELPRDPGILVAGGGPRNPGNISLPPDSRVTATGGIPMVRISVLVVSGLIGILGLPPEEAQKAMARGATAVVETGAEAVWTLFQGLKLTAQQIGLMAEEPPVPGAVRVPGRTRGPAEIFEKPGGMDEANKDFDDKKPENVGPLPNPDQPGGRRGTLLDGRGIVVRPMSTDGRPTLEIQGPGRRRIEVRYGSK